MNDLDELFQALVLNLAIVMYVRVVDDSKLVLVDVTMFAKRIFANGMCIVVSFILAN